MNWQWQSADGAMRSAGLRAGGSDGGDLIGPNPTDRGKKGVKRSVLVEADGGPLAIAIAGANVHDTKLLAATLNAVVVRRPQPTEAAPQRPAGTPALLAWTRGTTTRRGTRPLRHSATWPTSDESVRRSWMTGAKRHVLPGGGSWSALWPGYPSAGRC